jgi:hypothetical protein
VIENYLKAAATMTVLLSGWTVVRAAYRGSIAEAKNADMEGSIGCPAHCRRWTCGSVTPADCDGNPAEHNGNRAACDGNRADADFRTMKDTTDAARPTKGSAGGF